MSRNRAFGWTLVLAAFLGFLAVKAAMRTEHGPGLKISITSGPARVTTEPYRAKACAALLAGEFDHFWIEHEGSPGLEYVKAENCAK